MTKTEQAMRKALAFSRKLPWRPASPYGHLVLDEEAVKEAFRLCYEALWVYREVTNE